MLCDSFLLPDEQLSSLGALRQNICLLPNCQLMAGLGAGEPNPSAGNRLRECLTSSRKLLDPSLPVLHCSMSQFCRETGVKLFLLLLVSCCLGAWSFVSHLVFLAHLPQNLLCPPSPGNLSSLCVSPKNCRIIVIESLKVGLIMWPVREFTVQLFFIGCSESTMRFRFAQQQTPVLVNICLSSGNAGA